MKNKTSTTENDSNKIDVNPIVIGSIKCQSCDKDGGTEELHSCPFNADIYNDDSANCNCCEDCCHECAMDI